MSVFAQVLNKAVDAGVAPGGIIARTKDARDWFRAQAKKTAAKPEDVMREGGTNLTARVFIGRMYLFSYDAKHKKTLPYWDRYPLIFVVGPAPGGFYGINLHYLPHRLRAVLMDELMTIASNKRYNENTKLKLSYQLLKATKEMRYFEPCFKHYLKSQVRSRYLFIDASDWNTALFLPLESFEGATKTQVWSDSRRKISGAPTKRRP